MPSNLPIATQRKLLRLEKSNFKLQRQIVTLKARHEKEIKKLEDRIEKMSAGQIYLTEKQRLKLVELRKAALERTQ